MTQVPVKDQLQYLKGMTIRTGSIHEAQALQLRNWPLLIPNVVSAEAQVDVEGQSVTFICTSKGTRPTKKQKLTCDNICEWVRTLLWNETKVIIIVNKKTIFDSDRK